MGAVIHGRAGHSVMERDHGSAAARSAARRGAYFERQVEHMLHRWLGGRPDEVHVFHDLVGLNDVTGAGFPPISLGGSNIDHLILTGQTWLMIDAKGCGAGSLQVRDGKGVLVQDDGKLVPQPWMDERTAYSRAGVASRLTEGKRGQAIWVFPRTTSYSHASFRKARCFAHGALVLTDTEVAAGELDGRLPVPAPAADPSDVERLQMHVSAPDVLYRLDPAAMTWTGDARKSPDDLH